VRADAGLTVLVAVCALCGARWAQAGGPSEKAVAIPDAAQLQTTTTHPMKYYLSLPSGWSSNRTWPVLVAPSAHYAAKSRTIELFAPLRDARKSRLIIVVPLVINADPVLAMAEYRGAVMDSISVAVIHHVVLVRGALYEGTFLGLIPVAL
jgi:hypothetical protein